MTANGTSKVAGAAGVADFVRKKVGPEVLHQLKNVGEAVGIGAGITMTEHAAQKALDGKSKKASLDSALGALYTQFGPSVQKHAALNFYESLDSRSTAVEALGAPFCKLAAAIGESPWKLAMWATRSYEDLEQATKTASGAHQELAQFYVQWADEMIKKANLLTSAGNMLSKGKAVGNALVGNQGALRSSKHLATQGVVKSEAPGAAKSVANALKRENTLQNMGGGSIARGHKMHADNGASRFARMSDFPPATPEATAKVTDRTGPSDRFKQMLTGAAVMGGLGLGGAEMAGSEEPQLA